jgi:hypothetical protein
MKIDAVIKRIAEQVGLPAPLPAKRRGLFKTKYGRFDDVLFDRAHMGI